MGFGSLMNGRHLSFNEWWNEKVLGDGSNRFLTRGQIIRGMRDQDGGAHYDAIVSDPVYVAARNGELTGFKIEYNDGVTRPIPGGLEHTMRQIAEEARTAYRCIGPDLGVCGWAVASRGSTGEITFKSKNIGDS